MWAPEPGHLGSSPTSDVTGCVDTPPPSFSTPVLSCMNLEVPVAPNLTERCAQPCKVTVTPQCQREKQGFLFSDLLPVTQPAAGRAPLVDSGVCPCGRPRTANPAPRVLPGPSSPQRLMDRSVTAGFCSPASLPTRLPPVRSESKFTR